MDHWQRFSWAAQSKLVRCSARCAHQAVIASVTMPMIVWLVFKRRLTEIKPWGMSNRTFVQNLAWCRYLMVSSSACAATYAPFIALIMAPHYCRQAKETRLGKTCRPGISIILSSESAKEASSEKVGTLRMMKFVMSDAWCSVAAPLCRGAIRPDVVPPSSAGVSESTLVNIELRTVAQPSTALFRPHSPN